MARFIQAYRCIDRSRFIHELIVKLSNIVNFSANLHSSFRFYISVRSGRYVVAPPAVHENKLVQGFEGLRVTVAEIIARILDETAEIGLKKKFSEDVSAGIETLVGLTAVGDGY